jgi:AcrR family transcriptional regulator
MEVQPLPRSNRKEVLQNFRTRSLLEATRKVIGAEGFDAVTMERVAEEAGMTKGAIYLYFRNKDQLILSAVEEIASEILQQIEAHVELKAPPWERLCQTMRAQLEIMEEQKELLRVLLLDRRLLRDSPKGRQTRRLLRYRRRHEGNLKNILAAGVRRKAFPPMDAARAAFYINEMTIGTAQRRMIGLSPRSLERDVQGLIRFVSLLLRRRASRPAW